MTSTIRSVPGGGFGRTRRFHTQQATTPGPAYSPKRNNHIQGPVYRGQPLERAPAGVATLPHPNKDRTAWVLGTTKDDMAYYSIISEKQGPAYYEPDIAVIKPLANRNKFSKDGRFQGLTKRYISKAHNQANLCTAGPGPKYELKVSAMDLNRQVAPKWGMGDPTEFNTTRASFLESRIKNGYLYRAKPATADKRSGVGPASYKPKTAVIRPTYNRQRWTHADRFKNQHKQFITHKHTRSQVGYASPGPAVYEFRQKSIATQSRKKATASSTPAGKWKP